MSVPRWGWIVNSMVFLPLLLAACDTLPRDTDGTLARVQATRVVRVGVIGDAHADRQAIGALADRVAREANARVRSRRVRASRC